MLRQLPGDLAFSFRLLRRRPAFTLLATACLALGIGANGAIFSLLNSLLLRTLPVHDPARLVVLHHGNDSRISYRDYHDIARRFEKSGSMLATLPTESSLDRAGYQGQLVTAEAVTANYSRVLQVGTALGDWFDNEDSPVAVISYRIWQDLFHGNPHALGQQIRSETQWYTVIGVAPKDFHGLAVPKMTSIWVPLHIWTRQHPNMQARLEDRDSPFVTALARLAPQLTPSVAEAQLGVIETQLNRETVRRHIFTQPLMISPVRGVTNATDRGAIRTLLTLLFAVVGALLLICCINVGNLLLMRGASRQSEVAIRYSLGATRGRIVQQLFADNLLLAALGAIGGLLVNLGLVRLIIGLLPALPLGETISPDLPIDWRVLTFIAVSALGSVFLFGLFPAISGSSLTLASSIRTSLTTARGVKLRRSSVIAQVAVSFTLLVLAGLFLITCSRLQNVNPGFAIRNRVYATTYVSKPEFTAQQIPLFYQHVLATLQTTPGVRSAGLTYMLPLGVADRDCVSNSGSDKVDATTSIISTGYLHTLTIPLVQGRDFSDSDIANSQPVVLINQLLAQKLFPHGSAIGQSIKIGCGSTSSATILGIVANSRTASLQQPASPHVYRDFAQNPTGLTNIVVESSEPPAIAASELRRILLAQGHGLRVYSVNPLSQHVEESFWALRWESWLLGAFGAAALLLAALGLYGIISYSTIMRTKEFGIRIAIGAQARDILRLVLQEGFVLGLIGVCLGSAAVLSLSRFLRNYLIAQQTSITWACLGVALLWLAVGIAACYLPARRSARVEPSITLRFE